MKPFPFYFFLAFIAVACGSQPSNAPTIINEKYEPTDEELFAACAELRGIGQYIIGKSTFPTVIKDKEYRAQTSYSVGRENNLYNGHWGNGFWRNPFGKVDELEQARYIEKETKGKIKQLHNMLSFKVGELEFEPFDLAFLNDTLVAVWFYPKDEKAIVGHYLEKYGNGRGKKYHYESKTENLKGEFSLTEKTDEVHIWENESIALEYVNYVDFRSAPNEKTHLDSKHTMLIFSKSRYPVFEELLKEKAKDFEELKKRETEGTLNSL